MIASTTFAARLAVCAAVALLALASGAVRAKAATSCGIVSAARHSWIVVANGVSCAQAKQVVQGFAARTAALHNPSSVTVRSPLRGFHCVLASRGKPGGSCSTAGATKSVLWLAAA